MIQTKGNGELKLSKQKEQHKRPGREKKHCASKDCVISLACDSAHHSGNEEHL